MRLVYLLFLCFSLLSSSSWSAEPRLPGYIQLLVGQLKLSDNNVTMTRDGFDFEGSLDDIPYVGGAVQIPFNTGTYTYGWESGVFASWHNDNVNYFASSGPSGGIIGISVDNAYWSLETFLGLYGAVNAKDKVRLYVGAGPLFLFASAESDDSDHVVALVSSSIIIANVGSRDCDLSLGWSGRIGMAVRISEKSWIGFSARHMDTDVDLSSSLGHFDISGNVFLLSVTNHY